MRGLVAAEAGIGRAVTIEALQSQIEMCLWEYAIG